MGLEFALLITSSMWQPVSAGAHDNPAPRIIEGRIGQNLELFGDCRLRDRLYRGVFRTVIGPKTTAAVITCLGSNRVPRSATKDQRSCLLNISFVHDEETASGFFGSS